jgi:nucleoside-diphosphate-sugar epimerase
MADKTTVFVAGATGMLGSKIVESLLERGAGVRALVRPGTSGEKMDAVNALVAKGLEVVHGDLSDPVDQLARHLDGVDTIVSAVQGGPEVIVDGQVGLLRAAEKAGVARLIPSDFAIDLHRLDYGDNDLMDLRKKSHEEFEGTSVKLTSLLNGAYIEVMVAPFMQIVDWQEGTVSYYGDVDQPLDLITVPDAAAYTAAAALDAGVAGRPVRVAGEVVSMKQFHAAVARGSGRQLELRNLGSAEDLRAKIDKVKATSQNPFEHVPFQFQWSMVTGKGKLEPLDNDRYADIRPTTVEEFVRQNKG